MKFFEQLQKALAKTLGVICVVVFSVLVIDVLWAVFAREVLDAQPAWTEQLARLLLVWLAILGGVLAYSGDRHLGVDVLVSRFHPASRRHAHVIGHLCVFGFSVAVLLVGGIHLFRDRLASGQMMATLGISKAWFYLVLPVGGALISLLSIEKILALLLPVDGKGDE
ncbi:TRAP transporter small permease [Haloferula rosea]|uniref:TRAP transporter small permease n=1 Tax=Haloferula rosea TaxID=490093 RepID=A0A934VFK1_9BACT|nr:TRAP transporter small permease [Haloferula rosea]MBK1827072.1 TRAP transporter small permease [Haloferula rosea]